MRLIPSSRSTPIEAEPAFHPAGLLEESAQFNPGIGWSQHHRLAHRCTGGTCERETLGHALDQHCEGRSGHRQAVLFSGSVRPRLHHMYSMMCHRQPVTVHYQPRTPGSNTSPPVLLPLMVGARYRISCDPAMDGGVPEARRKNQDRFPIHRLRAQSFQAITGGRVLYRY